MTLPPFPVTTVGSWPRPEGLLRVERAVRRGAADVADFEATADAAVLDVIRAQERAGVDILTDGEQRRDNFYSFVAARLDGIRSMTLAEMFEVVDDKRAFEQLLQTLDVPASAISSPVCVGRLAPRRRLALEDARFLKEHTDRPIKVTLPGPYLLTRAMWLEGVSSRVYRSKEELAVDVVEILRGEARELTLLGVAVLQFDEPVLSEVVFAGGRTRTFMCASLAAKADPRDELAFASSLINAVLADLSEVRTAVHVCRGNWSRREERLLAGSYGPLARTLAGLRADQLVLEFATARAGRIGALYETASPHARELGLGVVDPRTTDVEDPNEIVARAQEALAYVRPDALFLNPDCGFASFSRRPVNDATTAERKLGAIASASRALRAGR